MNILNDLNELFSYLKEIRKLIYTTNVIEFLNCPLGNRNTFPDDGSVFQIMYLAINNISNKLDSFFEEEIYERGFPLNENESFTLESGWQD